VIVKHNVVPTSSSGAISTIVDYYLWYDLVWGLEYTVLRQCRKWVIYFKCTP